MDLAVKDKQNKIVGYIINATDLLEATEKAKIFKGFSLLVRVEKFYIPKNFKCCAMDATTLNQLILMNPKL